MRPFSWTAAWPILSSRPQESGQGDKWSFCLTAGTLCSANQERQRADDRAGTTHLASGPRWLLPPSKAIEHWLSWRSSSTSRRISGPTAACPGPAHREAAISTSTTAADLTRPLTGAHPIKLTSPRCPSAWRPNHGSRFTYPCGKTVQTTGGHLIEPAAAFELPLIMQPWREPATPIARQYRR